MPRTIDPPCLATILVVDDDEDLLRAMAGHLVGAGHACVTATDGDRALAAWRDQTFDLVITDLRMPGIDGCALIEALFEAEAVPVIVITGFRADFHRRLSGVPDLVVLEKPIAPSRLLDEVVQRIARPCRATHNAVHAAEEPARTP